LQRDILFPKVVDESNFHQIEKAYLLNIPDWLVLALYDGAGAAMGVSGQPTASGPRAGHLQ